MSTRPIATNYGHWSTLEQNCFNFAMSAFVKVKWVKVANYIKTRSGKLTPTFYLLIDRRSIPLLNRISIIWSLFYYCFCRPFLLYRPYRSASQCKSHYQKMERRFREKRDNLRASGIRFYSMYSDRDTERTPIPNNRIIIYNNKPN